MKKKTDLSTLDADIQGQDAVTYLDKVHFKNQMEMNPYNILVSPFEDPDKASCDFEDMEGRYKKKFAKPEAHRALEDIQGSIEELQYYLKKMKV